MPFPIFSNGDAKVRVVLLLAKEMGYFFCLFRLIIGFVNESHICLLQCIGYANKKALPVLNEFNPGNAVVW
jgi:hypothetical protein